MELIPSAQSLWTPDQGKKSRRRFLPIHDGAMGCTVTRRKASFANIHWIIWKVSRATIKECLQKAGPKVRDGIRAISVDTTGSSPVAVDKTGTPLALTPGFEKDPNAMFVLWKDHTSTKEAEEINAHAEKFDINYLQFVGGIYSSEWFWAKLLHVLRVDEAVRRSCYSWVEHCDWIPFVLTGGDRCSSDETGCL